MSEIHEIAKEYAEAGYSIIPIQKNSKKSKGPWKEYQSRIMDEAEIPKKFNGSGKMAIVCGNVSGGLELIDVDKADVFLPLKAMIEAKHPELLDKIVFTQTPNGYGMCYRCEEGVGPNRKLARGWIEVDGEGMHEWEGRGEYQAIESDGKWYIAPAYIETRGEAGYFLTWPSPGYQVLAGEFDGLEPLSGKDRESLLKLAISFDESPELETSSGVKGAVSEQKKRIPYPGDVYAEEVACGKLLEEYGWSVFHECADGRVHWSRPGRKKESGTVHPDNKFHVYTENFPPLEGGKQYSSFQLLTIMEYDGDFKEATRAVAEQGYICAIEPEELKEILKDNPDQVEDAFKRSGLSEAEVCKVLEELNLEIPGGKSAVRRMIWYDDLELRRVVQECDQALSEVDGAWGYYQFSDQVGHVTEENTFRGYDVDTLELRAEDSFYMKKLVSSGKGKSKPENVRVPRHVFQKLLVYPGSSAPRIKGFANHPLVVDGEVVGMKDGYDKGIMFRGCSEFQIDPRPWKECYDRLVELFCQDILFADKERGQALFVSMMMTALCRLGIDGGCPGYFITANEPGTGKSTLFEFVSRIVYGRLFESVDWGTDTVERRKEIISYLREGQECFLFDNIPQGEEVKSPILAQALTAGEFKARIMGKGEMTHIPAQSMFVFAGNNLTMSTELSRRLMTIQLEANRSNPARRRVKVKDVAAHCQEYRGEAIGCLLKMLKEGWSMENKLERSSGFTFWDKVVRNPIMNELGIDIEKGFDQSMEESSETSDVEELIHGLTAVFGIGKDFTTKEVYLAVATEKFLEEAEKEEAEAFKEGIEEECQMLRDLMIMQNARSVVSLKSTGKVMGGMAGRIAGGLKFIRHKTKSKKPIRHWIEVVEEDEEEVESC